MKLNDIVSTMEMGGSRTGRDVKGEVSESMCTIATG